MLCLSVLLMMSEIPPVVFSISTMWPDSPKMSLQCEEYERFHLIVGEALRQNPGSGEEGQKEPLSRQAVLQAGCGTPGAVCLPLGQWAKPCLSQMIHPSQPTAP